MSTGTHIQRGTRQFTLTNLALFSAGFSTFALVYCVQTLMPVFSQEFGISPAQSSLALSATTGCLAIAMLVASSVSEIVGRKSIMVVSLLVSALLMTGCAFVRSWEELVLLRALAGITFSGVPAVAMAYVSEEMDSRSVGLAMGLFISGSGLGGLSGRAIVGVVSDLSSWRMGLGAVGVVGLFCGLVLWRTLPASRHFRRSAPSIRGLGRSFAGHLRNTRLLALYGLGFLLLGCNVCIYNYTSFRLAAEPFLLSQTQVGFVFVIYLVGVFSAPYMGNLGAMLGRGLFLCLCLALVLAGALITLAPWLPAIVLGMAVGTFGFFGAHSIASSWIGIHAQAARAQASSLYLFAYYMGSSVIGTTGGLFWSAYGWPGVVAVISACVLLALASAVWLTRNTGQAAPPAIGPSEAA